MRFVWQIKDDNMIICIYNSICRLWCAGNGDFKIQKQKHSGLYVKTTMLRTACQCLCTWTFPTRHIPTIPNTSNTFKHMFTNCTLKLHDSTTRFIVWPCYNSASFKNHSLRMRIIDVRLRVQKPYQKIHFVFLQEKSAKTLPTKRTNLSHTHFFRSWRQVTTIGQIEVVGFCWIFCCQGINLLDHGNDTQLLSQVTDVCFGHRTTKIALGAVIDGKQRWRCTWKLGRS